MADRRRASTSFSQREWGMRDVAVTGVQTCALPIYSHNQDGLLQHHESFTCPTRRLGARLRQAMSSASRTGPFLAARKRTLVPPARPQAPLTGTKAPGWARATNSSCSGVSLPVPPPLGGDRRAAKI